MGITISNTRYDGDTANAEARVVVSTATNSTELICEAQSDGLLVSSDPATIFIAGLWNQDTLNNPYRTTSL